VSNQLGSKETWAWHLQQTFAPQNRLSSRPFYCSTVRAAIPV